MKTLEEAFAEAGQKATVMQKSASRLASLARQMAKGADQGNVAVIKRVQGNLQGALSELEQDVATAVAAWSLSDDEELQIMEEQYADNLIQYADENDLKIYEQDGVLISYPSIVRILPNERAVRVDRKKVANIHPEFLVNYLKKNQTKKSGFPPPRFLEALYAVYSDIISSQSAGNLPDTSGPVVRLARIYKLLTSLPGVSRDYDRSDFARDLYTLEIDGLRQTRRGATVAFPSSTGTRRRSSDVFSIVDPDGNRIEYYGIQFTEKD